MPTLEFIDVVALYVVDCSKTLKGRFDPVTIQTPICPVRSASETIFVAVAFILFEVQVFPPVTKVNAANA